MTKPNKKEQFICLIYARIPTEEDSREMTNICMSRPDDIPFMKWAREHDWTMGAIIALFRWQCLQFSGGLDWEEFESLYEIFRKKIYECLDNLEAAAS
jgi:hypothetical protein